MRTAYAQPGGWSWGLPGLAGDSRGLFWPWTCTAWRGPWPRWLCAVCGVSAEAGSRCLAEQPRLRPDLVLVRWRLLLLSPGLRCGRLHFLPLASAGRHLRQGLPSGEPAKRAPSRPCLGARSGGGASCFGGLGYLQAISNGWGISGLAPCLRQIRPSLPPRGPRVFSNRNSKKTHPRVPL